MILPRPQRLSHHAPPGSLLKRFDAPTPRIDARVKTGHAERDPDYLSMVRQCPCLKCGMEPSEAAHVRYACASFGKASGLAKKPDDRFALPLCSGCHRLDRDAQHNRGEKLFWIQLGINPLITCGKLYAQRGDMVAMRAVIFSAIAERGHPS
jgi:hypothetical protein